jgi:hypothetical protein
MLLGNYSQLGVHLVGLPGPWSAPRHHECDGSDCCQRRGTTNATEATAGLSRIYFGRPWPAARACCTLPGQVRGPDQAATYSHSWYFGSGVARGSTGVSSELRRISVAIARVTIPLRERRRKYATLVHLTFVGGGVTVAFFKHACSSTVAMTQISLMAIGYYCYLKFESRLRRA